MASAAFTAIPLDPNISGVVYGTRWTSALTFSFPDAFADYGAYTHTVSGFTQVSFEQRQAVRYMLEGESAYFGGPIFRYGSFEAVSGLVVSEALDFAGYSDLMFAQTNLFNGSNLATARVADFPIPEGPPVRNSSGDVWFGNDYAGTFNDYRDPQPGNYAWLTHLHEIGHAVGLKHGHNAGSPYNAVTLPANRDSMEFSVMTYRSYVGAGTGGYTNEEFGYAQTLMMSDIAALQFLYGADFSTNSGNTTYTWSPSTGQMFLNGVGQGAPGANRVFLTVWDGGGKDMYDMSNYSNKVKINLNPGNWSTTSEAQKAFLGNGEEARANVFNAYLFNGDLRSLIENARGGPKADTIVGNQAANKLFGNNGADVLSGLAGSDTLVGGKKGDLLIGGPGNDIYSGEIGKDSYLLRATLNASSNVDRFKDFSHADDTIQLDRSFFAGIGALGVLAGAKFRVGSNAQDGNDRVVYKQSDRKLFYDEDGVGGDGKVLIARFDGNPNLQANDFLVVA